MVRRLLCLMLALAGLVCLSVPGVASADSGGLSSYQVKLTGWPGDQAGESVAIGDVNGDGVPDYIIGDPDAGPNGETGAGSVYVIYGEASDKTTPRTVNLEDIPLAGQGSSTLGYRIDGWSAGDHFGQSVAVGDLNNALNEATGKPIDDIIVGDPDGSPLGRSGAGEVYVIYGQAGESTPELDVSTLTSTQMTLIAGWSAGDHFGASLAVGNFNNEQPLGADCSEVNLPTLAIGDPDGSPAGDSQAGEVYMLYGQYLEPGTGTFDVQQLADSNTDGYIIQGSWGGDQLGEALADAGNVSGNCNDGLLIGDPDAGPNGMPQSGTVYVVYGQPGYDHPGNEAISSLENNGNAEGYRINGPTAGAHYGYSVANAGDINGDGIPDVIAGAPNWNNGAGEAIITYGESAGDDPDVNTATLSSSGQPSVGYAIQGSTQDVDVTSTQGRVTGTANINPCDYMTEWTNTGSSWPKSTSVTAEGDRVGTTVAGLGDVNGDGIPDVLVGAPGSNDSAGAVAVVYGRRSAPHGAVAAAPVDNQQLYPSGETLNQLDLGTVYTDSNTPAPQTPVYGSGNPWTGDSALAGQVIEQTEDFQQVGSSLGDVYCSNYMWEPGDQAASAIASTGNGANGLAVVSAPTYGTTPNLAFHGWPLNPTVWFNYGGLFAVGNDLRGVQSGEADWNENAGSGAIYVMAL